MFLFCYRTKIYNFQRCFSQYVLFTKERNLKYDKIEIKLQKLQVSKPILFNVLTKKPKQFFCTIQRICISSLSSSVLNFTYNFKKNNISFFRTSSFPPNFQPPSLINPTPQILRRPRPRLGPLRLRERAGGHPRPQEAARLRDPPFVRGEDPRPGRRRTAPHRRHRAGGARDRRRRPEPPVPGGQVHGAAPGAGDRRGGPRGAAAGDKGGGPGRGDQRGGVLHVQRDRERVRVFQVSDGDKVELTF